MRSSDWSSDVCSSDLLLNEGFRRMLVNACFWTMGMEKRIKPRNNVDFVGPYEPTDRKSVVSGKSVSVRVDLGGRRIIKKKTHETSGTRAAPEHHRYKKDTNRNEHQNQIETTKR